MNYLRISSKFNWGFQFKRLSRKAGKMEFDKREKSFGSPLEALVGIIQRYEEDIVER